MEDITQSTEAFLQDELVTIALESSPRTFTISKAFLCGASDYFVRALNGKFKEAADRTLRLPGCNEEALRFLIYYLTHDKKLLDLVEICDQKPGAWDERDSEKSQFTRQHLLILLQLWKFAGTILMPTLQDAATEWFCKLMDRTMLDVDVVRAAFADTAEDSPLRKAMVEQDISDWQLGYLMPEDSEHVRIMDEMGAVSGFFPLFCQLLPLWMEGRDYDETRAPCVGENWEQYRVQESA